MYDINILVNGSRCKQYNHNGKIFIEAKDGSEYVIEIKNNAWKRILAVCSVDGLDILSGKPAKEDAPGYVINGYNTGKFDGFRVSDEKVAKFVFGAKGESYAAGKEDGSEKNVGVIGIRLFNEKETPLPPQPIHIHHDHWYNPSPWHPWTPMWRYSTGGEGTIWCDNTLSSTLGDVADSCYGLGTYGSSTGGTVKYSCDNIPVASPGPDGDTLKGSSGQLSNPLRRKITAQNMSDNFKKCLKSSEIEKAIAKSYGDELKGFDMGTKWGEAKESRVIEVEFEKGILTLSTNIYYASRQSLIEMGVPIGNEKQVSFPEPFTDSKYAKPPKNWKG